MWDWLGSLSFFLVVRYNTASVASLSPSQLTVSFIHRRRCWFAPLGLPVISVCVCMCVCVCVNPASNEITMKFRIILCFHFHFSLVLEDSLVVAVGRLLRQRAAYIVDGDVIIRGERERASQASRVFSFFIT